MSKNMNYIKFPHDIKQSLPCIYCNQLMKSSYNGFAQVTMKCDKHHDINKHLDLYFIFDYDNINKNPNLIYLSSVNYNINNVKLVSFIQDGNSHISIFKYNQWKINPDIKISQFWSMDKSLNQIMERIEMYKVFY